MNPRAAVLAGALVSCALGAGAEVIWLRDGDRLTGRIVSETRRSVRLQTPYGRLLIPKSRIARLVRADGKEEVLNPPSPAPPPAAAPEPVTRIVLVVTGASFWQAWDRRDAPADPTLRLELRLDGEPIASWTDAHLDPEDLPGAVVNTFAFEAGEAAGLPGPDVSLGAPEVQPGRVQLSVERRGHAAGERSIELAYQANEGTSEQPAWRDLAAATRPVALSEAAPALIDVRQARGGMEYSGFPRKRMRNLDTFLIDIVPGSRPAAAPVSPP
ncbi:MAG TPA: hypothetical protein VMR21_07445 [Vicinamibacteria bacterium]|nr:hypothetical protein [Vicinamibacteria bacterium]